MRTGPTSLTFRGSKTVTTAALVLALVAFATASARADIIRTATSVTFSGAISNSAGPVSAAATLWVDGTTLNLLLQNTSTTATIAPAGLLTSFYFGLYSGTTSGTAPALTYLSGTGQVYKPLSGTNADVPGTWTPPVIAGGTGTFTPYAPGLSDLRGLKKGDLTWEFRDGLSLTASEPPLNFGIGTVGNNSLSPNNFNGDIVDGNDFGIYVGDATTASVASVGYVVSGSAFFRFGGFPAGFTIANIPDHAVFGLGSGPDLIITVPEPATVALAAIGAVAALGWRLRRRNAWLGRILRSTAVAVVAGIVVVTLLFAVPARAASDPVPVADWNFAAGTGGLGWTSQTFSSLSPTVPVTGTYWDYWQAPSATAAYWHVAPKRGAAPPNWFVNTLTSPVITVPQKVDALDFIIRQRFNFPTDINSGKPLVVGELAWRYYDPANLAAPFQPFAPSVFATGTVPPPYNALSPIPTWVPNNYTVGTFGVPPLVADGGGWTGISPGWSHHDFVMTQVTLDGGLQPGQQVQFRFINAILGVQCNGSEWDVSRVTVIGQLPEPGGVALATIGVGSAALGVVVRGRRSRLTSGPRARA